MAADGTGGGDHGLGEAGLPLGRLELFLVAGEGEGVAGGELFKEFPEGAGIQYGAEAVIGPHGEVVAALGAHGELLGHQTPLAFLAALGTLDHLVAGNIVVPHGFHGQQPGPAAGKNGIAHASSSLSESRRLKSSKDGRFSSRKAVAQAPRTKVGWYKIW